MVRVLQLRNDEVSEFRGRSMVPLKEHEIQDAEFQSYEQRMANEFDVTIGPDGLPLDSRDIIRRQRKRMKEMVLQRLRAANKILNYGDIVNEEPMPDFGGLVAAVGKMFEARRPLRPERKERLRKRIKIRHCKQAAISTCF